MSVKCSCVERLEARCCHPHTIQGLEIMILFKRWKYTPSLFAIYPFFGATPSLHPPKAVEFDVFLVSPGVFSISEETVFFSDVILLTVFLSSICHSNLSQPARDLECQCGRFFRQARVPCIPINLRLFPHVSMVCHIRQVLFLCCRCCCRCCPPVLFDS